MLHHRQDMVWLHNPSKLDAVMPAALRRHQHDVQSRVDGNLTNTFIVCQKTVINTFGAENLATKTKVRLRLLWHCAVLHPLSVHTAARWRMRLVPSRGRQGACAQLTTLVDTHAVCVGATTYRASGLVAAKVQRNNLLDEKRRGRRERTRNVQSLETHFEDGAAVCIFVCRRKTVARGVFFACWKNVARGRQFVLYREHGRCSEEFVLSTSECHKHQKALNNPETYPSPRLPSSRHQKKKAQR